MRKLGLEPRSTAPNAIMILGRTIAGQGNEYHVLRRVSNYTISADPTPQGVGGHNVVTSWG